MASANPTTDVVRQGKRFLDIVWENCHEFFDKEKHIDVTFLWRNYPKRVTAHRVILAAASVYFDQLFQTSKGAAPAIYIENIPPDEFELLIAYCYTGKLKPRMPNVNRLLNGATILKLDGAAAICTAYLQGSTAGTRPGSNPAFLLDPNLSAPSNNTNKSILAVRRCSEKKDTESFIYRCDELEKVWIQCDVLKFPQRSPNLVYAKKHLISLGGFSDDETPSNGVYAYSLVTKVWRKMQSMSVTRVELSVECVNDFIYAIGGRGSNPCVALKTAAKLNTSTEQWIALPDMFTARSEATAVAHDDQIYVIGGLGSNGKPLKSVECFNTLTGKWRKCSDMIQPRFDFGAAFFKGLLYVIGSGNKMHPLDCSVECYNPQTDTWSQAAPVNVPRYGICGINLSDRLMAIGGTSLTDFKGIIEVYKPTKNSWLQVKPLPLGGNYRCFVVPSKELTEIWSKSK